MADINFNSFYEKLDHVGQDKALAQAMLVVFATKKKSRVGRPYFGCYVHKFLFNPLDDETASMIRLDIGDAIEDEANGLSSRVEDYLVTVIANKTDSSFYVEVLFKTKYSSKEKLTFTLRRPTS